MKKKTNMTDGKEQNVYILEKGKLEDYLPEEYRNNSSRDDKITNVINLLYKNEEDYRQWKKGNQYESLEKIIKEILDKSNIKKSKRERKIRHYLNCLTNFLTRL